MDKLTLLAGWTLFYKSSMSQEESFLSHSCFVSNYTFSVGNEKSSFLDCCFSLIGGMTRMSPYNSLSLGAGGTLTSSFSLKGRPILSVKGGRAPSPTLLESSVELSLRERLDVALLVLLLLLLLFSVLSVELGKVWSSIWLFVYLWSRWSAEVCKSITPLLVANQGIWLLRSLDISALFASDDWRDWSRIVLFTSWYSCYQASDRARKHRHYRGPEWHWVKVNC